MKNLNNFLKKAFKAYDNKSSLAIIKKTGEKFDKSDKRLFVVAGPNGSGKTTLIANLYNLGILDVPYINADLFASTLYSFITDERDRNLKSMYYTMDMVEKYINVGKSFCYETVLSHPSKIDLIKEAKARGYNVISIFVFLSSPEKNIERVKLRTSQGGHDVPEDKIRDRYIRSLKFSNMLENISDEFYRLDNSKTLPIVNLDREK